MRVGVLALQGGFRPHLAMIERMGHQPIEVRSKASLDRSEAIVLCGGESTTQAKLLEAAGLSEPVRRAVSDRPALATCAGLILVAAWGRLDAQVERNAYGPQTRSFEAITDQGREAVFIRAPRIRRVGGSVEVLDTLKGEPVLVRSGRLTAATFHPELTAAGIDFVSRATGRPSTARWR